MSTDTARQVYTASEDAHGSGSPQKTLWEQGSIAATLALIAGYVDAYAFLTSKVYASFMSGNTTQTGLQTGAANLGMAGRNLLPIPLFVAGIFVGTLVLHSRLRQPMRWLFAAVATLLVVTMDGASLGILPNWCAVTFLSFAMGAMNTTVTRVGAQAVSLGYVTGSLNNLAQHLALAVKRLPVPQSEGAWDTHGRRAALLASVWASFLIGALLSGAATPRFAALTLLPPILILAALAMFTPTTPDDT